ncbi:hypothetical protein [Parafrankia sp. EUN1f]|uniref:hypothetical protein n=1 Tax=Parafrankia sp. EUN1f TaxID=102897 RepID=UPI0001C477FE|nr:hypothetical protein [Parafrankia sp. EUN1f]EFC79534.1 hypothetical protein FrEUN1fDRAFT_7348 [Parafrankia sp. EUN1f]
MPDPANIDPDATKILGPGGPSHPPGWPWAHHGSTSQHPPRTWGGPPPDQTGRPAGSGGRRPGPGGHAGGPAGSGAPDSSGEGGGPGSSGRPAVPGEPAGSDRSGSRPLTRRGLITGAAGLGALAAGGAAAWRLTGGGSDGQQWWPGNPDLPVRADGSTPAPTAASKLPQGMLTIFGAPGSFGGLDASSPIGVVEVPGWGFGPGQAAFMSAVAADGTVLIGTTPFTDDQSALTGTGMELGLFEPGTRRFTRMVVPSSTGRQTQPRTDPLFSGIGGGDISDVIVVPAPAGEQGERAVFVSLMPYYFWDVRTYGLLPAFGQLRRGGADGAWGYEPDLSRTGDALAGSTEPWVAATAFPAGPNGQPRSARGMTSIARLPRSGHLVVAQYLGTGKGGTDNGALLVLDLDGRVRAFWQYPQTRPLGVELVVNPREVAADPTSEPDDERFVLICDVRDANHRTQPFPIQEFSYQASTGRITPRSTAVRAVQDGSRMETAAFGADGTLYVARTKADGLRADKLAVYPKIGRERGLVSRTPATGNWPVDSWGRDNPADFLVPGTDRGGLVRSLTIDPVTGAVLLGGLDGLVTAVRPAGSGSRMTFRTLDPVDVGLDRLRGPSTRYVGLRRGAVDAQRRTLWLPVNQMVLDGIRWPYPPFKLDQWLLGLNLDFLLEG